VVAPLRAIRGRLSRAALHAAGAAGAVMTLTDCTTGGSTEAFYGAPCVDGSCNYTYDAGQDAGHDSAGEVFYGGSCVGEDCGVSPVVDASGDAEGGVDGASGDASMGDAPGGDGPTDAGDGG
jgi:hypothetical protein